MDDFTGEINEMKRDVLELISKVVFKQEERLKDLEERVRCQAEELENVRQDAQETQAHLRDMQNHLDIYFANMQNYLDSSLAALDESQKSFANSCTQRLKDLANSAFNDEREVELEEIRKSLNEELESVRTRLEDRQYELVADLQKAQSRLEAELSGTKEALVARLNERLADVEGRVPALVGERVRQVVQENPQLYNEKAEELLNSLDNIQNGDGALSCEPEAIMAFGRLFSQLVKKLQSEGLKISVEDDDRQKAVYDHFRGLASILNTNTNNADSLAVLLRERLRYGLFSSVPKDIRQQIMGIFGDIFALAMSDSNFIDIERTLLSDNVVPILKNIGCEIINPNSEEPYNPDTMVNATGTSKDGGKVIACNKPGVAWRLANGKLEVGTKAEVVL